MKLPPPTISASGRGRCRAAGRVAYSLGRKTYPTRPVRIVVGLAAGSAIRHQSLV